MQNLLKPLLVASASFCPLTPAISPYSPSVLTALAFAVGSILRLLAFTSDHSLWIDESMVALNIMSRSPAQLFEPLAHNQSAPVGFLLACKASVAVFGPNEIALRLPAFLVSLVGLFAFAFAAFRLLPAMAARLAVWLFALSPFLVAYAGECKQYSSDATACAVLLALAAGLLNGRPGRWRWVAFALGGAATVWCSHPSLFVLAGLGTTIFARAVIRKDRTAIIASILLGAAWFVSFAVVYAVNLRHMGENKYLQEYWAVHFLKWPTTPAAASWIVEKLSQFLVYPGGVGKIVALPVLIGVVALAREANGRYLLAALAGPFAFALIASALKKYPFDGRLLLFLVPLLILPLAHGAAELAEMIGNKSRFASGAVLAFLLAAPALESREQLRHPRHAEELKAVLTELQSRWQPGDRLYVYNGSGDAGAGPALAFYAMQFQFPKDAVILGGIHRGQPVKYLAEVRAIPAGGRVWLLTSHEHRDEVTILRAYFDTVRTAGSAIERRGSAAYAYDER